MLGTMKYADSVIADVSFRSNDEEFMACMGAAGRTE